MSNEEMNIEEVELRISNYLILFEGKELTRRQTIAKITHIQLSEGEVCGECDGEGKTFKLENKTAKVINCPVCRGSGIIPVTIEDVIKEKSGENNKS